MTNRIEETYRGYKLIAQKDENGIVYTSASKDNNVAFWFRDNTGQDFKTTEQAMAVAKKMVDEMYKTDK